MINNSLNFNTIFPGLPSDIRENLKQTYSQIINNYREGKFEPSELNGGKLCESVYRLLEWHTNSNNQYTPFGTQIRNFGQSTRNFENLSQFPDSVRFHIPHMLNSIYSLRNRRGVGHIGGDINPNHMDSVVITQISKWVLSELIRLFHGLSLEEAETQVESIISKEYPIIWEISGKKRILNISLNFEDKTLILLYTNYPKSISEGELTSWLEYSNPTTYRKKILTPLHKKRMIEYNTKSKEIFLSPLGIKHVEENIDLKI